MTTEDKEKDAPKASTAKTTTRKRTTKAASESKSGGKKASKSTAAAPKRRSRASKTKAEAAVAEAPPAPTLPRLLVRQREDVATTLIKEFGYTSPMQVPRLEKIILNIGLGEALDNARAVENATNDLTRISGQKPVTTRARKSIAAFKVRQGMAIGVSVTLRGRRMYEFLDRLMNAALPRVRDFRGVPRNSFDGRGNYALGIREQVIFPEIDYNSIDKLRGLQVVVVTTAKADREGQRLLELLGMPFERTQSAAA